MQIKTSAKLITIYQETEAILIYKKSISETAAIVESLTYSVLEIFTF